MKKQAFIEVAAALMILLFVYASVSKFLAFHQFIGEINNQPLPNSWTPFLVWTIPGSEILISILLIFERTRLVGFVASLVFMSVFTIYTLIILFHGFSYVPCSCGGVIEKLTWGQHLALNLFFVCISALSILLQRRRKVNSSKKIKVQYTK
jgi:putative oxidoreductase